MKIKEGFVLSHVGTDIVAAATGELAKHFNGVVILNGSGEFLWNCLAAGGDEDSLVCAMLDKYDVTEDIARASAAAFIKKLSDAGILE